MAIRQRLFAVLTLALLLLLGLSALGSVRGQDDDLAEVGEDFDEGEFPEGDFPEGELPEGEDYPDPPGIHGEEDDPSEIPEGDDGDVIALTTEGLKEKAEEGKPFLVEFYAPWCGHCKALAPAFREAAAVLKESGVSLYKIDATKDEKAALEYGVEGYPTLLWVVGKKIKQFNGGRTSSDIVSWVKKKIGMAVTTIKTAEEAKSLLDKTGVLVVGYFMDLKGEEAAAFATSAQEADDVNYVQTDVAAAAEALGATVLGPAAVAVVKKHDDKFVAFEGKFVADEITQFSMANRLPLFVTFSDEAAQLVFGGSIKKLVFLFFNNSEYTDLTALFAPVAREFKGKVIFIYVNSSDVNMDNVREFFNIETNAKLAVGFSTEKREDGEKFQMDAELTVENLKEFATGLVQGTAKRFFKSEPIPEENDGPVSVVVGNSFDSIVLDPTKDVLLEIYAPWCGHCKALEPTYVKLGEKFKGIGSVVIAKMDGTTNEHPDVKVEGYPMILFYPGNDKANPVAVGNERKLSALINFVKEHASFPFEAPEVKPEEEAAEENDDLPPEDDELLPEDEELSEEELAEEAELQRKEEF